MRASTFLLPIAAALLAPAHAQPADSAEADSFQSIELRGGGTVIVRHGPERRVTVTAPNPGREIRIEGDALMIDRCRGDCRGGHRIEIEVVTPGIGAVAVSDGGTIELAGDFPPQRAVAASVSDGGTVDIRALEPDSVTASVSQGGRILAHPRSELVASVSNGGNVVHWGDASVISSVHRGGVVERGDDADLRRPLARLGAAFGPPPVVAVVPPTPPVQVRKQ